MASKVNVLLVGSGGVGTMAAYALEKGGLAKVTAVLRSNFDAVEKTGFCIDSLDHGSDIRGFRPSKSKLVTSLSIPMNQSATGICKKIVVTHLQFVGPFQTLRRRVSNHLTLLLLQQRMFQISNLR
jgi:ketopantoate reductase